MQVMQRIAEGIDFFKANWDWMAIAVGTIGLYHFLVHCPDAPEDKQQDPLGKASHPMPPVSEPRSRGCRVPTP